MLDKPIDVDEIKKAALQLKNRKSVGIDLISNEIIKCFVDAFSIFKVKREDSHIKSLPQITLIFFHTKEGNCPPTVCFHNEQKIKEQRLDENKELTTRQFLLSVVAKTQFVYFQNWCTLLHRGSQFPYKVGNGR